MQKAEDNSLSCPLAVASESTSWVMHLGPCSIGSNGVDVRPQMKLGGQYGNFVVETGFSDIRDGLRFDMGCRAFVDVDGAGDSLAEVHDCIKQRMNSNMVSASSSVSTLVENLGFDKTCADRVCSVSCQPQVLSDVLDVANRVLSSSASDTSSRLHQIAKTLGIDIAELESILDGAGAQRGSKAMTLTVRASTGMGVRGQMCLGWCDLEGYHMVGAGAKATTIVAMGLEIFAGKHSSGVGMRIVLGIGNFTLTYTFPLATPNQVHLAMCKS